METATYRDGFASGGYSAKVTLRPAGRAHATTNPEDAMTAREAAGAAAYADRASARYFVTIGNETPCREVEVGSRSEAIALAHATNGTWTTAASRARYGARL